MVPYAYNLIEEGIYECVLDLNLLYSNSDLTKFYDRYKDFCAADKFISDVVILKDNKLVYRHKSWIPKKSDHRQKVLFLFGNPAPHSVLADVYFAYEGNGKEHRFWKVMREVGLIKINLTEVDSMRKDKEIKEKFMDLNYISPFTIGMEVLYTFPSAASHPKWSGVAGLQKLFGKKVFNMLTYLETERILSLINEFITDNGKVISFQKDAFNALASPESKYDIKKAVSGELNSIIYNRISLIGIPPTRWLYTTKMKNILRQIALS